jgi:hypothetical protein
MTTSGARSLDETQQGRGWPVAGTAWGATVVPNRPQVGALPALPGLCALRGSCGGRRSGLRAGIAATPAPPPCRRSRWSVSRVRHPAAEGIKKQAERDHTGSRVRAKAARPGGATAGRSQSKTPWVPRSGGRNLRALSGQSVEVDLVMQAELAM